jgi:hypothetical protein
MSGKTRADVWCFFCLKQNSDAEFDGERTSGAGDRPIVVASSSAESVVSSSSTTTVANTDSADDTDLDAELLD